MSNMAIRRCFLTILFMAISVHAQVTFLERAEELNIVESQFSCGVGIVNIDDDSMNEIIITNHNGPDRLYVWQDSIYQDMGAIYGLGQVPSGHHNVALTDVDKNDLPDLFITSEPNHGYHGHLYVNYGYPPFADEAGSYNLAGANEMGSAFFQFLPTSELSVLCGNRFMVREGQCFYDITEGSGFETLSNVHCPLFFDIDGDNDDDLFVAANWGELDGRLFRNDGDSSFTDISTNTSAGGFPDCGGACFGDIDNDGDFDLYLTSSIVNSMWANDGTGYFIDVTSQSHTGYTGFTRGANFGDYDNDGDIDLFLNRATDYNMLLLNNGNGIFQDYSQPAGVIDSRNGFGCSTGDLNNDGQLDIVTANCNNQQNQVYINQNQNNSYLKIKLIGRYPNTLAFGAIVDLYGFCGEPPLQVYLGKRQMVSLSSMFSFDEPVIHFGTGDYQQLRVVVTFNSLRVIDSSGVAPGQMITLNESSVVSVDEADKVLPDNYLAVNVYPNPFNTCTNIAIENDNADKYAIQIFDIRGRLIKEKYLTGRQVYVWDGTDNAGRAVSTGTYFVRVKTAERQATKKIVLLK
jgi:hypothetical protein